MIINFWSADVRLCFFTLKLVCVVADSRSALEQGSEAPVSPDKRKADGVLSSSRSETPVNSTHDQYQENFFSGFSTVTFTDATGFRLKYNIRRSKLSSL